MRIQTPLSCSELERLYLEEQLGVAAIAQRFGCSPATISNWLRRCNIATRSGRFQPIDVPRELLERLYAEERLSIGEIATRLGVSTGTVANRRRTYGIPRRARLAARVV